MIIAAQKPIQLNLFESTILNSVYLLADESPRGAFYRIWLIQDKSGYTVKKESGTKKHKLDSREWAFSESERAEKFFNQKVRQKLNPKRKKRKYKQAP